MNSVEDISIYSSGKSGEIVRGDWVIGEALREAFDAKGLKAGHHDPFSWYSRHYSSLAISLNPKLRPERLRGTGRSVAWVRGELTSWHSLSSFDIVYPSSIQLLAKLGELGVTAGRILRPAFNSLVFSGAFTDLSDRKGGTVFLNDFTGERWKDYGLGSVEPAELRIFGARVSQSRVSGHQIYPVAPERLAVHLAQSRYVFDSTLTKNFSGGSPNLRCLEAIAQGCAIFTDSKLALNQLGFVSPMSWSPGVDSISELMASPVDPKLQNQIRADQALLFREFTMINRSDELLLDLLK